MSGHRRLLFAWDVAAVVTVATTVTLLGLGACSNAASPTPDLGPAATAIAATGDIHTHDPALVIAAGAGATATGAAADVWYIFSTGDVRVGLGAPQVRRSVDAGHTWEDLGPVWEVKDEPYWAREVIKGVQNFWAPEVVFHDGLYYLYYAASTFGSNTSVIGLFTSPSLDPDDPAHHWTDQGEVWRSDGSTPYNAIDPAVIEDANGTPWMAFGSFWDGLFMIQLEWPSGKPAAAANPVHIADRGTPTNAIEAPYAVSRDGWYYLFFSRDSCCQGVDSTYNIAVGRSREVTGPYVDADGVPLLQDGGTSLLTTDGQVIGPGGQSVANGTLAFHFYDEALGGDFRLGLRTLAWTDDGWPVARTTAELEAAGDSSDLRLGS